MLRPLRSRNTFPWRHGIALSVYTKTFVAREGGHGGKGNFRNARPTAENRDAFPRPGYLQEIDIDLLPRGRRTSSAMMARLGPCFTVLYSFLALFSRIVPYNCLEIGHVPRPWRVPYVGCAGGGEKPVAQAGESSRRARPCNAERNSCRGVVTCWRGRSRGQKDCWPSNECLR